MSTATKDRTVKGRKATGKPAAKKTQSNNSGKAEIDWAAMLSEALNAPGSLGNTYCRFYNYSFLNQIRLLMQGVHEPVATYKRWGELGFQVQKGSKAKVVLAPIIITKRDEAGNPILKDGKIQKILVGFRDSRTVFAFSDTDGDELPDIELPAWDVKLALKALGIKRVRFAQTNGNIAGYSFIHEGEKRLAINPAAKYPTKTLLHEVAHLVLGHCDEDKVDEYQTHRGICEFEAEATAYLLAKELELTTWDAAESRAYIDNWLSGHTGEAEIDDFDRHASRIFSAANKILVAGRPTKGDDE